MFRRHGAKSNWGPETGFEVTNEASVAYARVRSKLTGKNRKILILLAPRDGFAIDEKTSRILGVFDFSSLEIPPKAPLLKGGCSRTLSDDIKCQ